MTHCAAVYVNRDNIFYAESKVSQNEADPPRRQRVRLNDPDPPPVRRRVRLYDPLVSGLPRRPRGRPTVYHNALYERHLRQFAKRIIERSSRFDFAPSSRGWEYVLEREGEITKGVEGEGGNGAGQPRTGRPALN